MHEVKSIEIYIILMHVLEVNLFFIMQMQIKALIII